MAKQISIIVATHNRAHAILPCLESVAHAIKAAKPAEAEIVVVDNASTDGTAALVMDWAKTCWAAVNLVREPQKGVSRARNCGIRAAQGDLLIFTDDDCRMDEGYVRDALRRFGADTVPVMRSGPVLLGDPADLPLTIKSVSEIRSWQRPMDTASEGELLGSALIGCNLAMPRAVVDRIGPFDEKLGPGTDCRASEDTDYFYRAYLAGIRLEAVPDMAVAHFHGRKTQEERIGLLKNYAIGNGALLAKYLFIHPNFCKHLYWLLKAYFKTEFLQKTEKSPARPLLRETLMHQMIGAIIYARSSLISLMIRTATAASIDRRGASIKPEIKVK